MGRQPTPPPALGGAHRRCRSHEEERPVSAARQTAPSPASGKGRRSPAAEAVCVGKARPGPGLCPGTGCPPEGPSLPWAVAAEGRSEFPSRCPSPAGWTQPLGPDQALAGPGGWGGSPSKRSLSLAQGVSAQALPAPRAPTLWSSSPVTAAASQCLREATRWQGRAVVLEGGREPRRG